MGGENRSHTEVAIAGGGLAGLVTAYELLDQGRRVVLIDKDTRDNVGGLARESFGGVRLSGIADATGARYVAIDDNTRIASGIGEALAAAQGQPVIVDVRIDYSKRTRFTKGVVGTVLKRFPLRDRARFIGRALLRKVTG